LLGGGGRHGKRGMPYADDFVMTFATHERALDAAAAKRAKEGRSFAEVCAIAGNLENGKGGELDSIVYLGARMTKAEIKRLGTPDPATGRSELQDYRVVHFATHGVMAGQLGDGEEPGLVLSPLPAANSAGDDDLLTAGEIAMLKLDADWVVLSACNTGASGEPGGEAFSGIARAFLYAGARSVLVSHWSVSTNAAVKITTSALRALSEGRQTTRSNALRGAMREILNEGTADTAAGRGTVKLHPAYWGAFALIGDSR
jgi:CHAT domain-containing protein